MKDRETKSPYQIGGSLPLNASTYVNRRADEELFNYLKSGEFCYVLNSRQMGKSSLRVRIMKRLESEGVICAVIDLSGSGKSDLNPERFYGGNLVQKVVSDSGLVKRFNWQNWWRKDKDLLSPLQRFEKFLREVLLVEIKENIVIFIDEIDAILSLNFSVEDFFASIRFFFNQRADRPEFYRLTFCLLGVATPGDLIADKQQTPFNIGKAIALTGFTFEEAKQSLTLGFKDKFNNPEKVLKEILYWTGGQPFLTQKLCDLTVKYAASTSPNISEIVKFYLIENWEERDNPEHLRTIRDRVLKNKQSTGRLLGLYQKIVTSTIGVNVENSVEYNQLRLSGLVVQKNKNLESYNPIYKEIFNQQWVESELDKLRPYSEAINAWLRSRRQDKSRLLRGQALEEALDWGRDKYLSNDDNVFIKASLEEELAAQKKVTEILENANREAQRLIDEAKKGTNLERAANQVLREFEFRRKGEIQCLLLAIETAETLQKMMPENRPLKDYPATSPLFVLQQILAKIKERNWYRHDDAVTDVCASHDGKMLATACKDRAARLWDWEGNKIATLTGHGASVTRVIFSPQGNSIATASEDGIVRLWALTGNKIGEFVSHSAPLWSVSFSRDGKYIAIAGNDGSVRLWNVANKTIAASLRHNHPVTGICFHPEGKILLTASFDGTASLWDLAGNHIKKIVSQGEAITSASLSPKGDLLAIARLDGTISLSNLDGDRALDFVCHSKSVTKVCFSPDGAIVATASLDETAQLWDLEGNPIAELIGHGGAVTSICFNSDGKKLLTSSFDRTVRLWDLEDSAGVELVGHSNRVSSICFSPRGDRLATASIDETARLWDLEGNEIAQLQGHTHWITRVSFSGNGELLATASIDETARLWDLEGNEIAVLRGHSARLNAVCFAGDFVVTGSADLTARAWDLAGNEVAVLRGHEDAVWDVSSSPDGKLIATASGDGKARLWDLAGNRIAEFAGSQKSVTNATFSPDGELIAIASAGASTKLWNLRGELITDFGEGSDSVAKVDFSSDGQFLATASSDRTVRLWELRGNLEAEFKGHTDSIAKICFSPTNAMLATASVDGSARLWDRMGNQIAEFRFSQAFNSQQQGRAIALTTISWSPEGKMLGGAGLEGKARLWRVESLAELLQRGREWLKYYQLTIDN